MKNNDGFEMKPLTSDLQKLLDAIDIVGAELHMQVERLDRNVAPDTVGESQHLEDLRKGYAVSSRYLGILRNYQQARLRRRANGESRPRTEANTPVTEVSTMDARSADGPYIDEETK